MIRRFSSERVERFAGHCVGAFCSEIGFRDVSEMQLSLMVRSCSDLSTIVGVLKAHYPIRHHGQHGELYKALQDKLNFELALYEICGKSADEKKRLIEEAIRQHDQYIAQTQKEKRAEEFIQDVMANIEHVSYELSAFLAKIRDLYSIQKNELRRLIQDDSEYTAAIRSLSDIYSRYLKRAIDLSRG